MLFGIYTKSERKSRKYCNNYYDTSCFLYIKKIKKNRFLLVWQSLKNLQSREITRSEE